MFEQPIVAFEPGSGFSLVGADIIVGEDEFEGVVIAADNLAKDFGKVTGADGSNPVIRQPCSTSRSKSCVLIGTVFKSPLIQSLHDGGLIDTSPIRGKWESWMTSCVASPMEGYDNALVIVGSDKRGAIFGTYSLCEQMGVSP